MNAIAQKILVAVSLFVAPAAAAQYSDLYIIPVAGHTRGAFGTSWRSDVVLHNMQSVPISVELALIESGRVASAAPLSIADGAQTSVLLMPGETRTLDDVAGNLGRDVTGALVIGADMPFAVTSRTWAEFPTGRTLGQSVVPVPIAGAADAVHDAAVLPALATNAQQRSNIGVFVAASRAPLVVEVKLLSAAGATLDSRLVVVNEAGFVHRQLSLPAATSGTAVVRIVEGDGIVVPYASVIHNTSAEAMFVSGPPIAARGADSRTMLLRAVNAPPALR